MNKMYQATAVAVVALAFVSISRHHTQVDTHAATAGTHIIEAVSGGPSPQQKIAISEQGLAAVEHAQLARVAINDGDITNAKKLLTQTRTLLDKIKTEDRPVTLTTTVKEANKKSHREQERAVLDMIPIASELRVIEGFARPEGDAVATRDNSLTSDQSTAAADQTMPAEPAQTTAKTGSELTKARHAAIEDAKEHMRNGDQAAAAKALKLADLMLVARQIDMPLAETSQHVDAALKLINNGKLHAANLELKKLQDSLVATVTVVDEPVEDAKVAMPSNETPKVVDQAG